MLILAGSWLAGGGPLPHPGALPSAARRRPWQPDGVLAVLLSLACSLVWGVGDYLGGLQTRRHPVVAVVAVSQTAGLIAVLSPCGARRRPAAAARPLARGCRRPARAVRGRGVLLRARGRDDQHRRPIAATSAAVPVIAGIVLGERPGPLQAAGLVAAFVGIVLASREPGAHPPEGAARRAVPLALVAALLLGLFLIALHGARGSDLLWVLVAARAFSVGVLAGGVPDPAAVRRPGARCRCWRSSGSPTPRPTGSSSRRPRSDCSRSSAC